MAKNRKELIGRCIKMNKLLTENQRISIRRIASELNISERSARNWVNGFSSCYDLMIKRGIVIVGRSYPDDLEID